MNKVEFKNILIVEDGDKLRNSLTEYFSAKNKVTACPTLKSAVALTGFIGLAIFDKKDEHGILQTVCAAEIGRASCRERV